MTQRELRGRCRSLPLLRQPPQLPSQPLEAALDPGQLAEDLRGVLRLSPTWAPGDSMDIRPADRYHDLRHHVASALIASSCSIKAVQEALGHASAKKTLDTYSRLWPADHDRIRAAGQQNLQRSTDIPRTLAPP